MACHSRESTIFDEKVLKKLLYGVNNTVIKYGEDFEPLQGVFVIDPTDSKLLINNKKTGNYEIIYTITNAFGKMERISRRIALGEKMGKG